MTTTITPAPSAPPTPAAAPAPLPNPQPGESRLEEILDPQLPLTAPGDLDRRIRQLLPCAQQRQLWLLLLDENDVQMPVMIPVGDLPLHRDGPAADGEGVGETLVMMHREFAVASFVFVLERQGSRSLTDDDAAWLQYLLEVGAGQNYRVRAVYLCHDEGVSAYDSDDLEELSRRRHQAVSASSADM